MAMPPKLPSAEFGTACGVPNVPTTPRPMTGAHGHDLPRRLIVKGNPHTARPGGHRWLVYQGAFGIYGTGRCATTPSSKRINTREGLSVVAAQGEHNRFEVGGKVGEEKVAKWIKNDLRITVC